MWLIPGAASIAALDLIIKKKIEAVPAESLPRSFCKGRVQLTRLHNHGMMLGLGKGKKKLPLIVSAAATLFVAGALVPPTLRQECAAPKAGLALILGGALGNLLDRARRGYVVDYVSFPRAGRSKNIVYNLSDFCIFGGTLLLALHELLHSRQ